jgi:hypothetical protein
VRMLLGLSVVLTIGSVAIHGLVPVLWFDIADGGYRSQPQGPWLVELLGGVRPDVVWRLVAIAMIGGVAMMAGVGGRFAALITALSFRAITGINSHTGGSYDLLLSNALYLAVLAPTTRTLSVDCKLRTGTWTDDTRQPSWVRWLFVYQIVLTYWTTGLQKVSSHWTPGGDFSALYYILQQPSWHRSDMRWVANIYPLTQLGTATSWLWEVLAPLWLLAVYYAATREREGRARRWFNRLHVREVFAILGVIFHVSIHVFMNVGPFSLVSLAYYPALYSHEELARAWKRLIPGRSA